MSYSLQHETDRLKVQLRLAEDRLAELRREQPPEERDAIALAKSRHDAVAALYGTVASNPVTGESSLAYRKRLLGHIQRYSPTFAEARLDSLDPTTLRPIEDTILAEAAAKARDPASYAPGQLVAVQERDTSGRTITKYHGDPMGWMSAFSHPGVVGRIVRDPPKA